MRLGWGVVALCLVACVHDGIQMQRDACSRDHGPDPDACLAVARERFGAKDGDAAVAMLEKEIAIVRNDHACLAHYPAAACFHGVVALLGEPAVGLLADYAIDPALLSLREPWTGKDSEGPHAQARAVLEGMCAQASDAVARQRACVVLGDLVLLERTKQTAGFESAPDGYDLACKIGPTDPAFEQAVLGIYQVPVCAVATSARRGSSIANGLAIIAKISQAAAQREASAADAAKREAARVAAVKQREAEAAAAAAREAAAISSRQIIASIAAEDWDLLLETLRARPGLGVLDDAAATALDKSWEVFSTWLVAQSNLVGAEIEVARDLRDAVPPDHALARTQTALRTRAITEAKRLAKLAGGPGGRFLHAALIAAVAGDPATIDAARAAYAELQKAVRSTLVLDKLAPACSALAKVPAPLGQPVHATASLACSIEPEHTWTMQESYMVNGVSTPTEVEHRGYKLVVHGTISMASANGQPIPVDVDEVVDEVADKLEHPYAAELAKVVDGLWSQLVAPLEATTASDALAAGQRALAQHNTKRAENELAIHALIAGSSEELDKLLAPYHVTFSQLVPSP